jgi:hypothetical protein
MHQMHVLISIIQTKPIILLNRCTHPTDHMSDLYVYGFDSHASGDI